MTSFCKEIYKMVGSLKFLFVERRTNIVLEESEVIKNINGKVSFKYMERD